MSIGDKLRALAGPCACASFAEAVSHHAQREGLLEGAIPAIADALDALADDTDALEVIDRSRGEPVWPGQQAAVDELRRLIRVGRERLAAVDAALSEVPQAAVPVASVPLRHLLADVAAGGYEDGDGNPIDPAEAAALLARLGGAPPLDEGEEDSAIAETFGPSGLPPEGVGFDDGEPAR